MNAPQLHRYTWIARDREDALTQTAHVEAQVGRWVSFVHQCERVERIDADGSLIVWHVEVESTIEEEEVTS